MNSITYDLATLTFRELLDAHLRGRFPGTRKPIRRWVVAILLLTFGLAFLGFVVGMTLWPRFPVETMAIAFGMAGAILPVRTLSRLQRAAKWLRTEGLCTTEIFPEGIIRRTRTREFKYLWVPGQKFIAIGEDVLIYLRSNEILWIPRRAFPSPEAIDAFLQTARSHYGAAMARR
jgi:hypothetical protein